MLVSGVLMPGKGVVGGLRKGSGSDSSGVVGREVGLENAGRRRDVRDGEARRFAGGRL